MDVIFLNYSTEDIHWVFVQHPVGILEQHTGSVLWWDAALCLLQVKLWVSSSPGHRIADVSGWRRLPTRALISSGTSQSVCICSPLLIFPLVYLPLISVTFLIMYHPSLFLSREISFLEVGGQEIYYIWSHFLLIIVFLTFMISKDTLKIWEKERTRQWYQHPIWHSKK